MLTTGIVITGWPGNPANAGSTEIGPIRPATLL
jgi:hypothetical protein